MIITKAAMERGKTQDLGASRRTEVIEWLNSLGDEFSMPLMASEDELRDRLFDGTVITCVLRRISPSLAEIPRSSCSSSEWAICFKRFLRVMEEIGVPTFSIVDLQQGSMSSVVECLLALRDRLEGENAGNGVSGVVKNAGQMASRGDAESTNPFEGSVIARDERSSSELKLPYRFGHVCSEIPTTSTDRTGHNFRQVSPAKQGHSNLSSIKFSETTKSNDIANAPTKFLLSSINGILDENINRKNEEIPQHVAFLLKSAVQELGHRLSTQSEHIRIQNNLIQSREEKYQSRIKVLEALANGTTEEMKIIINQLQLIKTEKSKIEEQKNLEKKHVTRLAKEKEDLENIIANFKQELQIAKEMYEQRCMEIESKSEESKAHLSEKVTEAEFLLTDSRKKIMDLEQGLESKCTIWNEKEKTIQNFICSELLSVQELRETYRALKETVLCSQMMFHNHLAELGLNLKVFKDIAENYDIVSAENRRLHNEIQELKGNIRVYCRIRPFLGDQNEKSTTISHVGDNGELFIINPSKQGKDGPRKFSFNKVFGPSTSQAEVFSDIQPLIRSVLDGYNVCIFAYGQTGSGKTYTMSGPDSTSADDWGVNYRALADLFDISTSRKDAYTFKIEVQMIEIYNEQVRDLLSDNDSMKRLGIWSATQPNGLSVPEASMFPVTSTEDVIRLIRIGQANRAAGSTALNENSSRSHCVLTAHVRAVNLKTGSASKGCLHLIDLAGSERLKDSEATGDRLKEAQHINKSLSALGDCIFALSQKNAHVPYRNSKLTQILQSSLGGQAKTVMFVQVNPDGKSYSETMSTLKFGERVSGVELGVARCNKEDGDVKDLLEQVASLKNVIARKDKEIERLQIIKNLKIHTAVPNTNDGTGFSLRRPSSSPGIQSQPELTKHDQLSSRRSLDHAEKYASVPEKSSEFNVISGRDRSHSLRTLLHDTEFQDLTDADSEERSSNISDGSFSLGTETDGSVSSAMENDFFPETDQQSGIPKEKSSKLSSRIKSFLLKTDHATSTKLKLNDPLKSRSKKTGSNQVTASAPKASKIWK